MKKLLILILLTTFLGSHAQDCSKLQKKCDSLQWVIKDENYRLNRINYYIKIVDKKPSQSKYLKGWIKRAINTK